MMAFELSASVDGRRPDTVQKLIILSDDSVITKQIQDTHTPDGTEINCDSFLQIIEEILYRAVPLGIQAAMQENSIPAGFTERVLETLSYIVNRISSEMAYKCLTSGDAHQIVISLLQLLSNYSWEAKLVLLLAAFVLMYSEFWILVKFRVSSKLASKIAILKQVPEVEKLKKQLDGLNNLIMLMLDLAKSIVEFTKLPALIVDLPELSRAVDNIPTAIYWAARGIVFSAVYTTQLTAANYEDPTLILGTLEKELSALADKNRSSNENLQKQLTDCYQMIEEEKKKSAYEDLVRLVEMNHIDNLKVLRALISGDNDEQPLIEGSTERTIRSGKYIILYGGSDLQEISEFTVTARRIGHQLGIPLEMVYVGTTTKSLQELRPLIDDIKNQRLSNCWDEVMMWFFWTRVASMLLSKIQVEANDEQDAVMQELEKLLMYDRMGTWALFQQRVRCDVNWAWPCSAPLIAKV
ncbi:UNVERIFIED_CONTAM: protein SIEVE ELEMENT OCCLUSION B [Sesamum radiatum]|uniref:Protein SIEVE ELEMENT OCCLUSION B n=1 Tax=Sesamum radiatum TaxID=300843 RepID=A0AAW2PXE5_SESRA